MQTDFDIVIVGGGLVGATMACALANSGRRVGLVEAHPVASKQTDEFDTRSIALNYHSRQIFSELALWQSMNISSQAIEHIHVSDKGHLGMVRLHANRFFPHPFGYVCEHQKILQALYTRISTSTNIQVISPAAVTQVSQASGRVNLQLEFQEGSQNNTSNRSTEISASLVIAADGGNSKLKRLLAVEDSWFDHEQTAFAANLQMQLNKVGWAYERFTAQGPMALLPLGDGRYSLIFTCHTKDQESVRNLNHAKFIEMLQTHFGYRLGRIEKLGKVSHFPLRRLKSTKEYSGRVIFIGNASHTLHPIAGQGFNLGLRDVWALTGLINGIESERLGNADFCALYAEQREKDHFLLVNATDTLAQLYSTHRILPVVLRNFLASTMNYLPSLQNPLVNRASGL